MTRELFGLSLGFAALIFLTLHAQAAALGFSFPRPLPREAAAIRPEAPR